MRFALNYSPQASTLLTEGRIKIDLYKCPDWTDLVTTAQQDGPAYIHFPIVAGRNTIPKLDLDAIEGWIARTDTVHVNAHFAPRLTDLPEGIDHDGVVEHGVREMEILTRRFGPERVILENIPYTACDNGRKLLPLGVDAAVIRDVILGAGCGLLLDMSHAVLTCENTNQDYETYLKTLPTHLLRELHITGIGIHPEMQIREDHLPLQEVDWARVDQIMGHIVRGEWACPFTVAMEYGGIGPTFDWRSDPEVIVTQAPRLYALCEQIKQGV